MSEHLQAVTTCAGDPAWRVRGHETVKRLLTDPRLGRTHPQPERAPRYSNSMIFGRPQPASPTEADEHARMRELLGPWFSPRRLTLLRPRVQAIVDGLLDELCGQPPPGEFHEAVSFPLPALVICEVLGVPYEDRGHFRRWSDDAADMGDEHRSMSGLAALWQYMQDLVEAKRREPGDDVLSELVRAEGEESERSASDEAAILGAGLLFAGHETTVAAIDKGMHDRRAPRPLRRTDPDPDHSGADRPRRHTDRPSSTSSASTNANSSPSSGSAAYTVWRWMRPPFGANSAKADERAVVGGAVLRRCLQESNDHEPCRFVPGALNAVAAHERIVGDERWTATRWPRRSMISAPAAT